MKKHKEKTIKILEERFCHLFMNPPISEEELFEKIRKYMSMVDPD